MGRLPAINENTAIVIMTQSDAVVQQHLVKTGGRLVPSGVHTVTPTVSDVWSSVPHLPARLRDSDGDCVGVDIETDTSYLAHDRLLFACGSASG